MLKTCFWFISVNLYTSVSYTSHFVHSRSQMKSEWRGSKLSEQLFTQLTVVIIVDCVYWLPAVVFHLVVNRKCNTVLAEGQVRSPECPTDLQRTFHYWLTGTPPTCSQEETVTLLWNVTLNFRDQNRTLSADFRVSLSVWGSIREGDWRSHCQYFRSNWSKFGHKKNKLSDISETQISVGARVWANCSALKFVWIFSLSSLLTSFLCGNLRRHFAPVFPSSTCFTPVFYWQSHETTLTQMLDW